jgi:signal transduction histidine kinase
MKLHNITGRYYFLVSMAILTVMGIVLFYVLRWAFNQEIDEKLHDNAGLIFKSLENTQVIIPGENSNIKIVGNSNQSFEHYRDTMFYAQADAESEPFRLLTAQREINGKTYQVQTWTSRLEWDDLFEVIFWIFFLTAILLFGVQWLVNRKVLNKLWRPFFLNLDKLKKYSIRQPVLPDFKRSSIDEFESFRQVAVRFSEQARDEFLSVKHFSENAAHEMQTPLSIIRNKLEQISQNEALSPEYLQKVAEAMDAGDRLSRLNRSLLLLTKLENDQFSLEETIHISHLLHDHLEVMADRFMMKKIALTTEIAEGILIKGNISLAEMLFTNLLQNMLRHTPENGQANIRLSSDAIIFHNSGNPSSLDPSKIFQRFYKGDASPGGTGLGLAIVKEICHVLHWTITYHFEQDSHVFAVYFPKL